MARRVAVFGTGRVGIVQAACLARGGFDVIGVDTDAAKIAALAAGKAPFREPGLQSLLREGLNSGRLSFTTCYQQAASAGEVHFICVGTPALPTADGADLSQLDTCIAALAPLLHRPCLVVGRCTVPSGTASMYAERLTKLAPIGHGAELAWNPEFLREGHAIADTIRPDRIIVGVTSVPAQTLLREIYAPQIAAGVPFLVSNLATAELAKVAANAFLATKISFINAIADMCQAVGADVLQLADALGRDPRIGPGALRPGPGFGGGCLPKDLQALIAQADDLGTGHAASLLSAVAAINTDRCARITTLAAEMIGGDLRDRAVAVLGAAYKPGTDDIRDSPALNVAAAIHHCGAAVTVYDPAAIAAARLTFPRLRYANSAIEAARGADLVLTLTEWPEFRDLDPEEVGRSVARRAVLDACYALNAARWQAARWHYQAPGHISSPLRTVQRAGHSEVLTVTTRD